MSITYTITTNFAAKDSLPENDPDKVIEGADFSTEFAAIKSAFATAAPTASPTFTGTATFANVTATGSTTLSSVDINGGAIDGTTIGSTTPSSGAFTTLSASGGYTGNVTGDVTGNVTSTGTSTFSTVDINGGAIDGTAIGSSSPAAGAFTTLSSSGGITGTLQTAAQPNVTSVGTLSSLAITGDLTVDTNTLYVDSTNNRLGVGTSSPTNVFHVSAGGFSTPALIQSTSTVSRLAFQDAGTTDANTVRLGSAGNDMSFLAGGSERVRIDSSGNVGIGTASPDNNASYKTLDVNGPAGGGGRIAVLANGSRVAQLYSNGTTDARLFTFGAYPLLFGTNLLERMRIDASGNLLVGTTSAPSSSVSGTMVSPVGANPNITLSVGSFTGSATNVSFINGNGVVGSIVTSGTATAYNTSSDVRLKENIQDADSSGSVIDAIQVRQFDWKADGSHQRYGFVAQELDLVYPEAVSKGETEEDTWGVDYSKLVPLLVKSVQELSAELNSVKAELAALKGA